MRYYNHHHCQSAHGINIFNTLIHDVFFLGNLISLSYSFNGQFCNPDYSHAYNQYTY